MPTVYVKWLYVSALFLSTLKIWAWNQDNSIASQSPYEWSKYNKNIWDGLSDDKLRMDMLRISYLTFYA